MLSTTTFLFLLLLSSLLSTLLLNANSHAATALSSSTTAHPSNSCSQPLLRSACLLHPSSTGTEPDDPAALDALAASFRALRGVPSHFDSEGENGAANVGVGVGDPRVDSFDGEKHKVMKALYASLTSSTLCADRLIATLGYPDHITEDRDITTRGITVASSSVPFMPGPVIAGGSHVEQQTDAVPFYLAYKWRGYHDFMWFEVCGETVSKSGWYSALE